MKIDNLGGMKAICKLLLLTAGIMTIASSRSLAQYEYLSTLDYQNLTVNRLANIPGVTRVTGNSAYDQNHQHFFFQGNATGALPFNLYTVDAVSATVLYSPVCPVGGLGSVYGLEYDNATDTLYSIYYNSTGDAYFSWIDPASGNVHPIKYLPSFAGFNMSTFDTKDHWYIVESGSSLVVIDAATGNILYNSPLSPGLGAANLVFDNSSGKLYGLCSPTGAPSPQFDSISLATGIEHLIGSLPPMSLPQISAYSIDEAGGRYFFVAQDTMNVACINNYLYIVDIGTGAILSKTVYPFAQNASSISEENVVYYSFDNKRGVLYALNWFPPPASTVNPYVNITASANPVCAGDLVTFTATPGATVVNPSYQWLVNGINTGISNSVYTNNHLQNNDTVYCIITDHSPCVVNNTDTSNRIVIKSTPLATTSLSIVASATTICTGYTVQFTAASVNGGNAPSWQWQLNGNKVGTNDAQFTTGTLKDGDQVSCILTSSVACSLPTPSSNTISMTVNPVPVLIMGNDTVIIRGASILLAPSITGAITSYQWTPVTGLDNPSAPQTIAKPAQSTTYQLLVATDQGCPATGKITVEVYAPLQMPTAFTPNKDGRNDLFRIPPSIEIDLHNFSIYDRWGQRVFLTTNSSEGWDGTIGGRPQPGGAYVWEIEYQDILTRKPARAKGTVMLIR